MWVNRDKSILVFWSWFLKCQFLQHVNSSSNCRVWLDTRCKTPLNTHLWPSVYFNVAALLGNCKQPKVIANGLFYLPGVFFCNYYIINKTSYLLNFGVFYHIAVTLKKQGLDSVLWNTWFWLVNGSILWFVHIFVMTLKRKKKFTFVPYKNKILNHSALSSHILKYFQLFNNSCPFIWLVSIQQ